MNIRIFIFFIAILSPFFSYAQTYTIAHIEYDIEGATLDWALEDAHTLHVGDSFETIEALEEALDQTRATLISLRILEAVEIEHDIDGDNNVTVNIKTVDSNNIIILPYFLYSSSSGLTLSARFRDYNFFGRNETFAIDLDYEDNSSKTDSLSIVQSLLFPFRWLEQRWFWGLYSNISYRFNEGFVGNVEGAFGLELPWLAHDILFLVAQDLHFDTIAAAALPYYLETTFVSRIDFDTGLTLPISGALKYNVALSALFPYRFEGALTAEHAVKLVLGHTLFSSTIHWLDNLRQGLDMRIGNRWEMNFRTLQLSPQLNVELAGYFAHTPLSLTGRIGGFVNFPQIPSGKLNINNDIAQNLRGVLDDRMSGNVGFYLNADFSLLVFTIPAEVMGLILPGFGFLIGDSEAHGSIFFDMGVATDTSRPFNINTDLRMAIGIEGFAFPTRFRNIYARISIGFDPVMIAKTGSLFGGDNPELFFGFGHLY